MEIDARTADKQGRAPSFTAATDDVKEGHQSMRMEVLDAADAAVEQKILRVYGVNSTLEPLLTRFHLEGFQGGISTGTVYTLADREQAMTSEVLNSRDDPARISTTSAPAEARGTEFQFTFKPLTVTLLELKLGG